MENAAQNPLIPMLNAIILGITGAVGSRYRPDPILGPALSVTLITLIAQRLTNLRLRFISLVGRIEAGTLRPLPEAGHARVRNPGAAASAHAKPEEIVKTAWGWVAALAFRYAFAHVGAFETLLKDPRMQALIAAEPRRMGRILRPLCRMLGVAEMPDLLRLPSQTHVETVDWDEVDRARQAELAYRAAGLPLPFPGQVVRTTPLPRFFFFVTPYGRPQLE